MPCSVTQVVPEPVTGVTESLTHANRPPAPATEHIDSATSFKVSALPEPTLQTLNSRPQSSDLSAAIFASPTSDTCTKSRRGKPPSYNGTAAPLASLFIKTTITPV